MTNIARRFVTDAPLKVISRIPRIGKLMIIGKRNGVTHERIGAVDAVAEDGACVLLQGAAHTSRIDASLVKTVVIDTSSIMQGKVYPRLDFNAADGQPVFSLVGFEGAEPFAAALAGLAIVDDPDTGPRPPRVEREALSPEDAGLTPFNAALAAGLPITIAFEQPGFFQQWQGVVAKVSPGMGFINVTTEDFHLHLLGATVGGWDAEPNGAAMTLYARDTAGQRTGLRLYAEDAATFTATSAVPAIAE